MRRTLSATVALIFLLLVVAGVLAAGVPDTELVAQEACTRFAVIGDYGDAGQPAADVAALVTRWNPEFIVTTGDNNYPEGDAATIDDNIGQYYQAFIASYRGQYGDGASTNRFFPALGNHDWAQGNVRPYLNYFSLPHNERYYDFVWGPVHFLIVDSDPNEPDGRTADSVQGQWIRERLARSTTPWQIVVMHHPPYTSGTHGSTEQLQWPYREWGADAVLAGHNHFYERLLVDGLPYLVNGAGGRSSLYDFETPIPGSLVRFNDDYGAMDVLACPEEITFEFVTRAGTVVDSYVLSRDFLVTDEAYLPFMLYADGQP